MSSNREILERFEYLQKKLEGQLNRKEYELALITTEDLIELCSSYNMEEFDIQTWLNYYSKIKEHLFMNTLDEKKQIIARLIQNQEIVSFKKFQNLMKLNYIENFDFVIKSLPETDIFSFREGRMEFVRPQNSTIQKEVNKFLKNLHIIIQ